jgi:hypothetical protein
VIARIESPPWRRGQPDNSQGSPGGARQSYEYYQSRTAKGFSLEHCEPVTPLDAADPQIQETAQQLRGCTCSAQAKFKH